MHHKVEVGLSADKLILETGLVARQAHGAVWLQWGQTIVLATACRSNHPTDKDFLPLTVEYREKSYAAGQIPGNIFKREGRPGETATLNARLVDHQIRPLFAKGFAYEVQVHLSVLSDDGQNDPDILAMVGASAALGLSDIPFAGPSGAVRLGQLQGKWVANPTHTQRQASPVDLIVSGVENGITSIEGSAEEVDEDALLEALDFARGPIGQLIAAQQQLIEKSGHKKLALPPRQTDTGLEEALNQAALAPIRQANRAASQTARGQALNQLKAELNTSPIAAKAPSQEALEALFDQLVRRDMRQMILGEKRRIDGRRLDEVRPIENRTGLLPRAHGSALFTRGYTQALCAATLGAESDERMVDDLAGKRFKSFYLDYNFPPFCVGEVGRVGFTGRREIGHGLLAERALAPVLPTAESFPYTVRLVADITESNSSSSMASVCAGSLALMDAGVPLKAAVSGAGVGLVKEGDNWELLTDIQGAEDHLGDMDLKVAGTRQGITAIQMDCKVQGISHAILTQAIKRSGQARLHVLDRMDQCLDTPRAELSQHAPRIERLQVPVEKIGAVIGPGGKTIRSLEQHGARVHIADDGLVSIAAADGEIVDRVRSQIEGLAGEATIGQIYQGTVKRLMPFGAFVEIMPGQDGLLHNSEIGAEKLSEGEAIAVKVIAIDVRGRIKLSHKTRLD